MTTTTATIAAFTATTAATPTTITASPTTITPAGTWVPMLALAQQLEQLVGLGILVVSVVLAGLSLVAYRRERDRRMLTVAFAYAMFAVNGFVVFVEYFVLAYGLLPFDQVELIEHGSSFLVLVGLLAFFVAIVRE